MVTSTCTNQSVKYTVRVRLLKLFEKCTNLSVRDGEEEEARKVPLTRSHKRDCCMYIFRRCY